MLYFIFIVFDLLALISFTLIGKQSHAEALVISELLQVILPFTIAWFAFGWGFGQAVPLAEMRWQHILRTTATSWLLALPLGMVLREIFYDKPILVSFVITTYIFAGILLIVGRLLAAYSYRRWFSDASK
jgi:hypothetical protein